MIKAAKDYKVGHALDADTQIGPVANEPQFKSNLDFIAQAKAEGADLAAGGKVVMGRKRGLYLAPTLFIGTRNEWRCNQHESFGPYRVGHQGRRPG
jgi:acyl-CoA reductase-like NAD-dependent aldehyde dehydrogenase